MVHPCDEPVDAILRLLSDRRYRHVVSTLREESVSSVSFLARQLDSEYPHSKPFPQELVLLEHVILPRLEQHGLIDYDSRTKTVRDESPTVVGEILEAIDEWHEQLPAQGIS